MTTNECDKFDALNNGIIVFSICRNTESKWFNQRVSPNCCRCIKPEKKPKAEKIPKPTRMKQAIGLARAVRDVIVDPRFVTQEQRDERLATCAKCEWLVKRRCIGLEGCGCFVAAKSLFKTWDCPRNKWPSV